MYERIINLIGNVNFNEIKSKKVLLVGIGGVGSFAFMALIRSGFQNITVIDKDRVDITNLNRQLIANLNTINENKVDVAITLAKNINPDIKIYSHCLNLNKDNINILDTDYDYIIDACDTITTKLELIKFAIKNNIKIISCLGTGNRLDPTKLVITDIWQTNYDPVAKILRKLLRDNNINTKIPVIWSKEIPIKTGDSQPGSICTVPAVAGIYMVSYIINDSLK